MKERYSLHCAVFLILTKEEDDKKYILLQKRQNTGIQDNLYDVSASGHLEKGETLREGIIRETKEEIGITIKEEDLEYISTIHSNFKGNEYLLIAFTTNKYEGTPTIMEPNKCSDLRWFGLDNLPSDIVETRKIMIKQYLNNEHYSEFGF